MSEQACPGPCNTRYREAQEAYKQALAGYDPLDPEQSRPDPPSLSPWLGEPYWCPPCKAAISLRLRQLETLADALAAKADGFGESAAAEHVSRSADPPSPSPAADDLDELTRMLRDWEDSYRELRGWTQAPPRGEMASVQTEVINWLAQRLSGILSHPDIAVPFGEEILAWHRGMKRRAKAGVATLRKPLRCPSCRLLTLTWTEGRDRVDCQNPDCARVLSFAEYETETARLAEAMERGEYDAA